MNIVLHINKIKELDEAVRVSIEIFRPTPEKARKYHDKNDWRQKIANGGLLVTASTDNKMAGFSLSYPKEGKFHLWVAGVLEKYRGQGIWTQMYEKTVEWAKEKGFASLTLNTYKAKFPHMYAFALKHGFEEYKTEGEKSFFIRKIPEVRYLAHL